MKVTANFPKADPSPLPDTMMVELMSYGDSQDVIDYFGLTCEHLWYEPKSNFRHADLYSIVGGFSAVTNFYKDLSSLYDYIVGLQPEDPYSSVQSRVNWLIGDTRGGDKPKRPMWWAQDKTGDVLRCGTSGFGGNPILIETKNGKPVIELHTAQYPARDKLEQIPFYRVVGMPKSALASASREETPYWIHRCSEALWKDGRDVILWSTKGGIILYPFMSFADYPNNTGQVDMLIATKYCREYKR
jgi:hypothetical protein